MELANGNGNFVAASDVSLEILGIDRMRIATGARTMVVEVSPDQLERLHLVMQVILPLLRRSSPLSGQLTPQQEDLIRPLLQKFIEIGVLFRVNVDICSESDRSLYTYLARRNATPDEAFNIAKSQKFLVEAPNEIRKEWERAFRLQGLNVVSNQPDASTISIVTESDKESLEAHAERFNELGLEWVPVQVSQTSISIGPWTSPGETACFKCNSTTVIGAKVPSIGQTSTSWLSMQPSSLALTGSILSLQALRVVAPIGPHHPWGTVVNVDLLRGRQSTTTAWKNPFCTTCSTQKPAQPSWVEKHVHS